MHERLMRRPTLRYARELERSQWWSPDQLRELQRTKLRDLFRHARTNVPFWRDRLDPARFHLEEADPEPQALACAESARAEALGSAGDPLAVLREIPLLDKTRIRESLEDLVWAGAPGGLHRFTTGGSSGEPLVFYLDRRRQAFDQAARIRSHRWFNVDLGQRELYLWGSPIEQQRGDGIKRWRNRLFNHCLLNAFDMSSRRMDSYLDAWDRFRPTCLFGYPSSIALLVEHAKSRHREVDLRSLRAVFVTGEVCYPHQRKTMGDYFGVPIADGYGSRDAGFIAHECPEGNMHITSENVIVETVDAAGSETAAGQAGEIVITHLDAYAMPFIRYRTGDVGRLKPGRCACGRGLPLIDVVEGRTTDFLYLPDGTVRHALSIIYPLRDMDGLRQFRVTQHEDYSVTVDVVADDAGVRISREAVMKRVRPVIGDDVGLRVDLVERIDTAPSGKYRYVISHAQPVAVAEREDHRAE